MNYLKRGMILFYLLVLITIKISGITHAHEVQTHRAINECIARNDYLGFSLNEYLKNNYGMTKGYDEKIANKEVYLWISDGGEKEDYDLRPLNHFHNPITNRGLTDLNYSALTWATLPVGIQSLGSFSWNDVRFYYYTALTSLDKTTRDINYARAFRGIGQIMHLVQDMSVPAHTRNDPHLPLFGGDDDYERWLSEPDTPPINSYAVEYYSSGNNSYLVPNLFDTDQYSGSNPGITMQSAIGLSEYTNANFLSRDTIFTDFANPSYDDMVPKIKYDPVTTKDILYLKKIGIGENIDYFARANNYYNYLPTNYKKLALTTDDPNVHRSYAAKLMPRAIGYSAQALSYFFRGQLDVTLNQGSLKIKNTSNETMTGGQFELYYDNSSDERILLNTTQVTTLVPNAEQTLFFNPPSLNVKSYMLVYKGTLGNEANAVIGKYIATMGSHLVFVTQGGSPDTWNLYLAECGKTGYKIIHSCTATLSLWTHYLFKCGPISGVGWDETNHQFLFFECRGTEVSSMYYSFTTYVHRINLDGSIAGTQTLATSVTGWSPSLSARVDVDPNTGNWNLTYVRDSSHYYGEEWGNVNLNTLYYYQYNSTGELLKSWEKILADIFTYREPEPQKTLRLSTGNVIVVPYALYDGWDMFNDTYYSCFRFIYCSEDGALSVYDENVESGGDIIPMYLRGMEKVGDKLYARYQELSGIMTGIRKSNINSPISSTFVYHNPDESHNDNNIITGLDSAEIYVDGYDGDVRSSANDQILYNIVEMSGNSTAAMAEAKI